MTPKLRTFINYITEQMPLSGQSANL
jgi:hypothetical protein